MSINNQKYRISLFDSKDTLFMEPEEVVDVNFKELAVLIKARSWSPSVYRDDAATGLRRIGENLKSIELLVLHVTRACTLDQIKCEFRGYQAIIADYVGGLEHPEGEQKGDAEPTYSHLMVIIPLSETITTDADFKATWNRAKAEWPYVDPKARSSIVCYRPCAQVLFVQDGSPFSAVRSFNSPGSRSPLHALGQPKHTQRATPYVRMDEAERRSLFEESQALQEEAAKKATTFVDPVFDPYYRLTMGLTLIGASSGHGKSTTAANLVHRFCIDNPEKDVIYISNEEDAATILNRIACIDCKMSFVHFRRGELPPAAKEAILAKAGDLTRQIEVVESKHHDMTVLEDVQEVFKTADAQREKCGLIVLDYLQTIHTSKLRPLKTWEVSKEIGYWLKEYGKTVTVPVVVFVQLKARSEAPDLASRICNDTTIYHHAASVVEVKPNFDQCTTEFVLHKIRFGDSQGHSVFLKYRYGWFESLSRSDLLGIVAESDPVKSQVAWPEPPETQIEKPGANDFVQSFLISECRPDPDRSTPRGKIYVAYRRFCTESRYYPPLDSKRLMARLNDLGFKRILTGDGEEIEGLSLLKREADDPHQGAGNKPSTSDPLASPASSPDGNGGATAAIPVTTEELPRMYKTPKEEEANDTLEELLYSPLEFDPEPTPEVTDEAEAFLTTCYAFEVPPAQDDFDYAPELDLNVTEQELAEDFENFEGILTPRRWKRPIRCEHCGAKIELLAAGFWRGQHPCRSCENHSIEEVYGPILSFDDCFEDEPREEALK